MENDRVLQWKGGRKKGNVDTQVLINGEICLG